MVCLAQNSYSLSTTMGLAKMKRIALFALMSLTLLGSVSGFAGSKHVTDAINDKERPEEDRKLDANRKPAQMVEFSGIKPGSLVMDIVPGSGYFTRIFAKVVGEKGRVYAYSPNEVDAFIQKRSPGMDVMKQFAQYKNVSVLHAPINSLSSPEELDVIWISQNYHDFFNKFFEPADVVAINKAVFAALKPGGVYIVLDHSAKSGSGLTVTDKLHRIEESVVKKQVLAAGFKFVGASKVLKNSKDRRDLTVFDPSVRGRTDQFILKFQKPVPKQQKKKK